MVELEIDGKKVEVPPGSMVMHAANELGLYIPHFCYHKKLSIAANCRMCLVEVEKAPKPLPACATPVTAGMKVYTRSQKAIDAQKSVMEFLLINHPLDCPICDQGGECQLQDLAVGYGGSASNYREAKRVVFHKSMGPLISAEGMTRCIHCTRCVRFGQEIGGVMELGMVNRGENSEIMSFLGRSVDSELSGNMIDLCPVGALTSKPFRFSARGWELTRRRSVAAHDSLGSNLVVQIKLDEVRRVLPLENEDVNECWISDRDRFSYEGLNAPDRLLAPKIKHDGQWHTVDWETALAYAGHALGSVASRHGAKRLGGLASPNATVEELYLLQKMLRCLGSDNVDFRLRQADTGFDTAIGAVPWLGMPVAEVDSLSAVFMVGMVLRKEQPLLSARVRQIAKRGAVVSSLHGFSQDLLMPTGTQLVSAPDEWVDRLREILAAVRGSGSADSADSGAQRIAASLLAEGRAAIWLGMGALAHPRAGDLLRIAGEIAQACGGVLGVLGDGANAVGGYLAGATPAATGALAASPVGGSGLAAAAMLAEPLAGYLLLNIEPSLDTAAGQGALRALAGADTVVALTCYESPDLLEVADCLLPVSPFTETAGCFVNMEGRAQSFNGVVRPAGEARPAWKVLRVLANRLELDGFDQASAEEVRKEALAGDIASRLGNAGRGTAGTGDTVSAELLRLAEVPIYWTDALVRRAESLQRTADAKPPVAGLNPATADRLGLADGELVVVAMGADRAELPVRIDAGVAERVVRVPAAHPLTAALGAMVGPVTVTRAAGAS
ncbi:MAG: NADH-quinone oxidoreductase subunit NuoG [Burkholderiaceae bacterium]|jgi:NADH-quinone oxidoreductase subunit G|nr:NADH-quinone oxidoreductase subunit NuoG [Burkholderiaceae bacterium]